MSARHGDVYFAAGEGLEETRHVFLAGNGLPRAWQNRHAFTIGETGFGTGLNFLAVWQMWRQWGPPGGRLNYVSVERFPLKPSDLERAHEPFGELAPLARRLRALYPHLYGGFHRLHFDDDRITLTLLWGEAGEMLNALDARVDAWFLDGFSPAKNPDLWRGEVLGRIGALTRPGGTAASFTVAGEVRRGLEAAGFQAEKAPGFGRKRHMLRARYMNPAKGAGFSRANAPRDTVPSTALVVGAGLAGSATARALARRGISVVIIDPDPDLQLAASGNPLGIAAPKPVADGGPTGRFHCTAFDYATRHYFRNAPDVFRPCGLLELAAGPRARRRHDTLACGTVLPGTVMHALDSKEASDAAGVTVSFPALHFPEGGTAFPAAYAGTLRDGIQMRVGRVDRLFPTAQGWTAELENGGIVSADIAVLACGNDSGRFGLTGAVPMTASRGQLSIFPASDRSAALQTALTYGGYLSPALEGHHVLGATYDDVAWPPEDSAARAHDHDRNYRTLSGTLPDFPVVPPGPHWRARVAFRCTTPDRLPVCGPVPEIDALPSRGGGKADTGLPIDRHVHRSYKDGLFLCAGLGSRGLTTAPLLGELLASGICADPMPTERVVTELLHPARFFARALRKAGFPPVS